MESIRLSTGSIQSKCDRGLFQFSSVAVIEAGAEEEEEEEGEE